MDTYELNKIAGAVLGTVLMVMFLQQIAGIIYHADEPETLGFALEIAESTGDETGGEAAQEETLSIAAIMADASAEDGPGLVRKCTACHTFEQGGENKIGPNLYDIMGREVASVDGFAYSDAMIERGAEIGTWDYESMYAFLEDPKGYVPGTKMAFAGVRRSGERADIIMYLREQSPSPMPLPEPEEAAASEGDAANTGDDAAMTDDAMEAAGDAASDAANTAEEAASDAADVAGDAVEAADDGASDAMAPGGESSSGAE